MKIVLSNHAEYNLKARKVLIEELLDTIRYPDRITKEFGKYYYEKKFQRGTLEAVCITTENHIKVVTLYWR